MLANPKSSHARRTELASGVATPSYPHSKNGLFNFKGKILTPSRSFQEGRLR